MNTIDGTKEKLWISAYVITDVSIIDAIERALRRNVHVNILIYSPEEINYENFHSMILRLKANYGHLLLHEIDGTVLHTKVIVSDYRDVIIGSANPTERGMFSNYELGIHIVDTVIATKIVNLLERLYRDEGILP
jgi:phosphatidylserine/phosphatidylglycerophosphate/cardiolipin synthase-like enzyme